VSDEWSEFKKDVESRSLPPGPRCSVGVLLEKLTPIGRKALTEVLEDRSFGVPAIAKSLKGSLREAAPSEWSLANHRRGKCACPR